MAFGGPFFNVQLNETDVPGAAFGQKTYEECTVVELRRWLECRGLKISGSRPELIQRSVQTASAS